jgi:hypothetical protein
VCPKDNDDPTWVEFNQIVDATNQNDGIIPSCPVADPCVVSPPPCFYVSTECVPAIVLNETLDNQKTRDWENMYQNEDEKYLHDAFDISDVTEWKLVSKQIAHDSPKLWDYNDGLIMTPFKGPDGSYHKVCTFALVETNYEAFDYGVEWGFSLAEDKGKDANGHTQAGQNSYGAKNHVYDAGHIFFGREMWQRSFGEPVAPRLTDSCSGIRESMWRNRLYREAQQFNSESYVFGTCARTCGEVSELGLRHIEAATLGHTQRNQNQSVARLSTRHNTPDPRSANLKIDAPPSGSTPPPTPGVLSAAALALVGAALVVGAVLRRRATPEGQTAKAERMPLLG